ncbi:MAG: hypothetical protein FJY97_04945 [candidate division Zixibacteria bacterium]|nr:hypothetical protein [candidate division Zixibacteria bacterium]
MEGMLGVPVSGAQLRGMFREGRVPLTSIAVNLVGNNSMSWIEVGRVAAINRPKKNEAIGRNGGTLIDGVIVLIVTAKVIGRIVEKIGGFLEEIIGPCCP